MSELPIKANELLDKLDTIDEIKKLERVLRFREKLSVSRHKFQNDDQLREGHITRGLLDIPVLEIIREVEGEEVVAELKALKRGTPRDNISSTLEYYSIAAECIIKARGEEDQISRLTLAMEPYRSEHLAYQLLEQCILVWDLLAEYDTSVEGQELRFMSAALRLSERYHKMMVSLIERDSLSRLKEGAEKRVQDQRNSLRRQQSMKLAREYIARRRSRAQVCKLSEILNYVKNNYVPDMDENPPSRNTLGDWIISDGIDISK